MSFSWMRRNYKKINRTPSPTLHQVEINQISRETNKTYFSSMERISLFVSSLHKELKGSMTVEATILLPLLLFFFLHILSAVEMLRLHGKLCFALWECGNSLTVYAAMPGEVEEQIPDIAVSYAYVKMRVEDFLGDNYLDTSPLAAGKNGLNYLASAYDDEYIDIGVTYRVAPQISVFPFPNVRLVNRYFAKAWSGYDIDQDIEFVYVTIYGEVWHRRADCSHISLMVKETEWNQISQLRNTRGGKYYPCEICENVEKGRKAFYTEQGDRHHVSRDCPALVRYVRAIMWEDKLPYKPCSRCAKEE